MLLRLSDDEMAAREHATAVPVDVWLLMACAVAAVVILFLSLTSFAGLDHLLLDGSPFLPFFTT